MSVGGGMSPIDLLKFFSERIDNEGFGILEDPYCFYGYKIDGLFIIPEDMECQVNFKRIEDDLPVTISSHLRYLDGHGDDQKVSISGWAIQIDWREDADLIVHYLTNGSRTKESYSNMSVMGRKLINEHKIGSEFNFELGSGYYVTYFVTETNYVQCSVKNRKLDILDLEYEIPVSHMVLDIDNTLTLKQFYNLFVESFYDTNKNPRCPDVKNFKFLKSLGATFQFKDDEDKIYIFENIILGEMIPGHVLRIDSEWDFCKQVSFLSGIPEPLVIDYIKGRILNHKTYPETWDIKLSLGCGYYISVTPSIEGDVVFLNFCLKTLYLPDVISRVRTSFIFN